MNDIVILDSEIGWARTSDNIDGGTPESVYGGNVNIDCGSV